MHSACAWFAGAVRYGASSCLAIHESGQCRERVKSLAVSKANMGNTTLSCSLGNVEFAKKPLNEI